MELWHSHLMTWSACTGLTLGFIPVVTALGRRCGWFDMPNGRKIHCRPTIRLGGAAMGLALAGGLLAGHWLAPGGGALIQRPWSGWALGALGVWVVGLWDDLRPLRARQKLLCQSAAAAIAWSTGLSIDQVGAPGWGSLSLGLWSLPVTVFWIVGLTNAVNLVDGLDGLAAGLGLIAATVVEILAWRLGDPVLQRLMLGLIGVLVGFLLFNFHPARIFMGDSGSLLLGFTLASATAWTGGRGDTLAGAGWPLIALGIPVCDTLFCMVRRFVQRRSLMAPDRCHFHHRLLDLGFSQRQVALTAYGLTAGLTALASLALIGSPLSSLGILLGCGVLWLTVFRMVGAVRLGQTLAALRRRSQIQRMLHQDQSSFEALELQVRQAQSPQTWWQGVCRVGEELDFAWMTLRVRDPKGHEQTAVWRAREEADASADILTVKLPLRDSLNHRHGAIDIAVVNHGSWEAAAHRVCLFGRLIDQTHPRELRLCSGRPSESTAI